MVRAGDAASATWQKILCDPIWHAGSHRGVVLLAQTAVLLYLTLLLVFLSHTFHRFTVT